MLPGSPEHEPASRSAARFHAGTVSRRRGRGESKKLRIAPGI